MPDTHVLFAIFSNVEIMTKADIIARNDLYDQANVNGALCRVFWVKWWMGTQYCPWWLLCTIWAHSFDHRDRGGNYNLCQKNSGKIYEPFRAQISSLISRKPWKSGHSGFGVPGSWPFKIHGFFHTKYIKIPHLGFGSCCATLLLLQFAMNTKSISIATQKSKTWF